MNRKALKAVFLDTVPVLTGYLFMGMGFGVLLAEQTGHGILWSLAMAITVFAGSAQYLAVGLLAEHASILSVAVATFLLNARHIFYGISLIDTYKGTGWKKPYLIFSLTDETYSLVTQNRTPDGLSRHRYCFLVSLLNHSYWIIGCGLGSLLQSAVHINFQGVEFVLTALFVTMFVDQLLTHKNHVPAVIGVAATALCLVVFGKDVFLIPSMLLIAVLLVTTKKYNGGIENV